MGPNGSSSNYRTDSYGTISFADLNRKQGSSEKTVLTRINRKLRNDSLKNPVERMLELHEGSTSLIALIRTGTSHALEVHRMISEFALEMSKIKEDPGYEDALLEKCARESVFRGQTLDADLPISGAKRRKALEDLVAELLEDANDALAVQAEAGLKEPDEGTSKLSWLVKEHWKVGGKFPIRIPSVALDVLLSDGSTPYELIENDGPISDNELEMVKVLYGESKQGGTYATLKAAFEAAKVL